MNSRLILSDCREPLEPYLPGTAAQRTANFRGKLNQVLERLTYSGLWKGAITTVKFDSSAGYITLPPRYFSALSATYDRSPIQTFNQWHQYVESGPGTLDEALGWFGQLNDDGDGFCSQLDISTGAPGGVRVYSSGVDNGKVVRLYGIQEETEEPITDSSGDEGEQIVLNAPFVQSTKHYSEMTGFIKVPTNGPVTLKVAPTSGAAEYQIGYYQPSETRPCYRRYKTGVAEKVIRILCQRRFFPVIAETDWVIPGNLAALKFGLRALALEDVGYDADSSGAKALWDQAFYWLNQEAKALRGGAKVPSGEQIWGSGQNLARVN